MLYCIEQLREFGASARGHQRGCLGLVAELEQCLILHLVISSRVI